MKKFSLEYDSDYGIDNRRGWSVAINGHYYVAFKRFFVVALIKAFYLHWKLSERP